MAKIELEAGVVYEKQSQYFLAIGPSLLVTYVAGEWSEIRPYTRYRVLRELSVGDLRLSWGLSARELDAHLSQYFKPERDESKVERGSRRRAWSDKRWREFRTFRHASERRAG